MKKILGLLALVSALGVSGNAEAATAQEYYSGQPLTLYVRTTGSDLAGTKGTTTDTAYKSLYSALVAIPDGFLAPITIDVDSNTYVLPMMTVVAQPGSTVVSSARQTGSIKIRGTCASTLKTWTTSVTWAAVTNKKNQVTGNIGSWTGTVTDGSHFVRSGSASAYTYKTVRTSTSPNLKTVDSSTTAYAGTLCSYGTILSGSPTFAAVLDSQSKPFVSFEAVSFSGTPVLTGVTLKGSKVATVGALSDVDIQSSYLGTDVDLTGTVRGVAKLQDVLVKDCVKLHGQIDVLDGVVAPTAYCGGAQVVAGGTSGVDGGAFIPKIPDGLTSVRQIESLDIEGEGTCLMLVGASARLGGGNAAHDMTCYPLDAGVCLELHQGSKFGIYDYRSAITGTVITGPSQVQSGSTLGPLYGGYDVVSSVGADGGADFTNGAAVGVTEASLPDTDATGLTLIYQLP